MYNFIIWYRKALGKFRFLLAESKVDPVIGILGIVSAVILGTVGRKHNKRVWLDVYFPAAYSEQRLCLYYEEKPVTTAVWSVYAESFIVFVVITYLVHSHLISPFP